MGMGAALFLSSLEWLLGLTQTLTSGYRIEQKGSIFVCRWVVMLLCYSFRIEVKNALVSVLRAWYRNRG